MPKTAVVSFSDAPRLSRREAKEADAMTQRIPVKRPTAPEASLFQRVPRPCCPWQRRVGHNVYSRPPHCQIHQLPAQSWSRPLHCQFPQLPAHFWRRTSNLDVVLPHCTAPVVACHPKCCLGHSAIGQRLCRLRRCHALTSSPAVHGSVGRLMAPRRLAESRRQWTRCPAVLSAARLSAAWLPRRRRCSRSLRRCLVISRETSVSSRSSGLWTHGNCVATTNKLSPLPSSCPWDHTVEPRPFLSS
mmetsp:Transcript_126098/g.251793  ORF Transcript_126098/g.251793 Transcript_126098/m.251793 type:complete len:245 (+) Transcript_126098:124-858(+)